MDFESLRNGAVGLVLSMTASFNTVPSAGQPVATAPLQTPIIIASENISEPESIQNLNEAVIEENKLEMITKEPEALPSQDVMFYTVTQPTPKPTVKPTEEPKIEIIKEAKAEEKKEEIKESPSPIPSPSASTSPSPTPAPALTGSNADRMFQMANDHRAKLGKPAFEKDERLCKIAQDRAPQINGELASGNLHAGFKALNLPYWATENIAAYQTIEENFKFWIADYIHRIAVEGDHKYSCVACSGASCSQIFSSFVQK